MIDWISVIIAGIALMVSFFTLLLGERRANKNTFDQHRRDVLNIVTDLRGLFSQAKISRIELHEFASKYVSGSKLPGADPSRTETMTTLYSKFYGIITSY